MPDEERQDDLSLLARAGRGDRGAFDALVVRHQGAVMAIARALTRDEATAEDAFQDAFLAAYRGARKFRGGATVKTWLLQIARHAAWRQGRRRAGEPARFEALDRLGMAAGWRDSGSTPETAAARAEVRGAVRGAMRRLGACSA